MANRPIKIQQPTPGVDKPYCIAPIGMFCNSKLQSAQPGDEVVFCFEKRRDKRVINQICRFRINTPEFTFMLRTIYGEDMTIARLLERWEAWAVVEGIGKEGFSREQCIILEVEPLERE